MDGSPGGYDRYERWKESRTVMTKERTRTYSDPARGKQTTLAFGGTSLPPTPPLSASPSPRHARHPPAQGLSPLLPRLAVVSNYASPSNPGRVRSGSAGGGREDRIQAQGGERVERETPARVRGERSSPAAVKTRRVRTASGEIKKVVVAPPRQRSKSRDATFVTPSTSFSTRAPLPTPSPSPSRQRSPSFAATPPPHPQRSPRNHSTRSPPQPLSSSSSTNTITHAEDAPSFASTSKLPAPNPSSRYTSSPTPPSSKRLSKISRGGPTFRLDRPHAYPDSFIASRQSISRESSLSGDDIVGQLPGGWSAQVKAVEVRRKERDSNGQPPDPEEWARQRRLSSLISGLGIVMGSSTLDAPVLHTQEEGEGLELVEEEDMEEVDDNYGSYAVREEDEVESSTGDEDDDERSNGGGMSESECYESAEEGEEAGWVNGRRTSKRLSKRSSRDTDQSRRSSTYLVVDRSGHHSGRSSPTTQRSTGLSVETAVVSDSIGIACDGPQDCEESPTTLSQLVRQSWRLSKGGTHDFTTLEQPRPRPVEASIPEEAPPVVKSEPVIVVAPSSSKVASLSSYTPSPRPLSPLPAPAPPSPITFRSTSATTRSTVLLPSSPATLPPLSTTSLPPVSLPRAVSPTPPPKPAASPRRLFLTEPPIFIAPPPVVVPVIAPSPPAVRAVSPAPRSATPISYVRVAQAQLRQSPATVSPSVVVAPPTVPHSPPLVPHDFPAYSINDSTNWDWRSPTFIAAAQLSSSSSDTSAKPLREQTGRSPAPNVSKPLPVVVAPPLVKPRTTASPTLQPSKSSARLSTLFSLGRVKSKDAETKQEAPTRSSPQLISLSRRPSTDKLPPRRVSDASQPRRISNPSTPTVVVSTTPSIGSSPFSNRTWRSTMSAEDYEALVDRYGRLEMRRQEVIWELCETEKSFVTGLRGVIRVFTLPLRTPTGAWIKGVPMTVSRLLDWLDDIVHLHSQISTALQSHRLSHVGMVSKIADVLLPFVGRLEVHQPYLVRFEAVTRSIDEMTADFDSDFGEYVRMQSSLPECAALSLSSFLLKPVQRLMKYPLFFKQLCDLTPPTHPDHIAILSLLHSTDSMIRVMQEVKTREDEYEEAKALQSRLRGLPEGFELAQRDRRLVAHGLLRRVHISDRDRSTLEMDTMARLGVDCSSVGGARGSGKVGTPPSTTPPGPGGLRSYSTVSDSGSSSRSVGSMSFSDASCASWTSPPTPETSFSHDANPSALRPDSLLSNSSASVYSEDSTYKGSPTIVSVFTPASAPERPARRVVKTRAKESSIYAFVFSDLVVLATKSSDGGRFRSKNMARRSETGPVYKVLETIGLARVLGVSDLSGKTEHEHLIEVDLLPMPTGDEQISTFALGQSVAATSIYITLPEPSSSARRLPTPAARMKERTRWLQAFERSYLFALRSLSFPSLLNAHNLPITQHERLSFASAAAEHLLPKSPSQQLVGFPEDPNDLEREERAWWALRLKKVRRELEGNLEGQFGSVLGGLGAGGSEWAGRREQGAGERTREREHTLMAGRGLGIMGAD